MSKHTIKSLLILLFSIIAIEAEDKRFAVIIPSYCNAQWYQKNLESLLSQDYSNWYAIYIDDCSSDGTADLVKQFIKERGLENKFYVIANKDRKGALANHYIATHMCNPFDIVVQYDGDDWFTHERVFSNLNQLYQDENVWLTYGSFEDWPIGKRGYSKPTSQQVVDNQLYRETYWTPGQLRTFYAWLFQAIKLEDFIWDHDDEWRGKFFPASCDLAFSYPLMEMVGNHFRYIDEVIYVHNIATNLNDFKVNRIPQIIASNTLMYKKKYQPIKAIPQAVQQPFKGADVMIISFTGLHDCQETLASCYTNLEGVANIFVLDVINNTVGRCEGMQVVPVDITYQSTITLLTKELHNWWKAAKHVLFITNGLLVKESLNLSSMAQELDKTQAFAFFPSLGIYNYPHCPSVHLKDGVYVWKLCYAKRSWMLGSSQLCVFGHKEKLRERIAYLNEDLLKNLFLKDIFADGMLMINDTTISRIGLSFEYPKIMER